MSVQSPQQHFDFEPAPQTSQAPVRTEPAPAPSSSLSLPQAVAAPRELWAAVQFAPDPPEATRAEIAARHNALLERAQQLTPRVAFEPPDALLLELAGSRRLFGGLAGLLCKLRETFPAPFTLAAAPTPLAALVLARAGRARCLTNPARLVSRLSPLPVALLRWPEEDLLRLKSMGVERIGELLRLPREGLARRFGPAQLDGLDRLIGRRADPRPLRLPEERFARRVDPSFETADAGRLIAALGPTLAQLEDFLRARQRGLSALRLVFEHRRGAPAVLLLRLALPEYRAARFAALLAARLESLQLSGPVRRILLTAGRLRPLPGLDGALWRAGEQGGQGAADLPEFLQTLMSRLGERAVYGLALVPGHRPEQQWRNVWPGDAASAGQEREEMPPEMPDYRERPLGLLHQPRLLQVHAQAEGGALLHEGRPLTLLRGPERIESGWWDGGDIARDYYIARAGDGALWWVFRERGGARGWFVHGCFA